MVREGVAVTVPATQDDPVIRSYALAEQDARKAYRGLWSSTFQMPWTGAPAVTSRGQPIARGEATP